MSYTATKQLVERLETLFHEFDVKVADSQVEYMKRKFEHLQEVKKEFESLKHNVFAYYPKLFAATGGKGNYQLIQYGINPRVEEIIRKSEKSKVDKRNFRIANKLEESNITEVTDTKVLYSPSGFNGVFEVMTDKGSKKVIVDTIFVYGEIQCPHYRVLVNVK
jgi:hypothetical protein